MRLLGVSGSPSQGSRTARVIREVLRAAEQHRGVQTELIEISRYALVFCDGRKPELYEGDTRVVLDKVAAADAYIVGSPMYRGSYTGALKNLFDLVPNDALRGKGVGLVATGGSDHHFLALEHQLRPLLSFFHAYTVPGTVYAQNAHFEDESLDKELLDRCRMLGDAVVSLARGLQGEASGPRYPTIERKPEQRA